jgi:hypothetical protein
MDIIIVPPAPKLVKVTNWQSTQFVSTDAFNMTGRTTYLCDHQVVARLPVRIVLPREVLGVCLLREVVAADLVDELEKHGYKMIDPFTQMDINRSSPTFADSFPNVTQHLVDGSFVFSVVGRWFGEREVVVDCGACKWFDGYFFLCVKI